MVLPGHCNAPAALGLGFADGPLLIHGHCNDSATLPDAGTAASWPPQRL